MYKRIDPFLHQELCICSIFYILYILYTYCTNVNITKKGNRVFKPQRSWVNFSPFIWQCLLPGVGWVIFKITGITRSRLKCSLEIYWAEILDAK